MRKVKINDNSSTKLNGNKNQISNLEKHDSKVFDFNCSFSNNDIFCALKY